MAGGEALVDTTGGTGVGHNGLDSMGGGEAAHCANVITATIVPIGMAIHRMKDVNWG